MRRARPEEAAASQIEKAMDQDAVFTGSNGKDL